MGWGCGVEVSLTDFSNCKPSLCLPSMYGTIYDPCVVVESFLCYSGKDESDWCIAFDFTHHFNYSVCQVILWYNNSNQSVFAFPMNSQQTSKCQQQNKP